MPSDQMVAAVGSVSVGVRTSVGPTGGGGNESAAPTDTLSASPVVINPTLRLDPALGLVVVEFHNDRGELTTSIPSQYMLQAYQRWNDTHFGPAPPGTTSTVADSQPSPEIDAASQPTQSTASSANPSQGPNSPSVSPGSSGTRQSVQT